MLSASSGDYSCTHAGAISTASTIAFSINAISRRLSNYRGKTTPLMTSRGRGATSAVTIFCKVEFLMLVIFHADTVLRAPAISFSVDAMRCHRTWNIKPIAGFRMPWFASRAEGIGGIYAQANVEQGGAELEAALANYQAPVTHFPPAPPPEREELDLHDDERDFGAPPTPLLSRHDDNLHPEKHGHGPRGQHLHRRKGSQRRYR